jgi:hypothetical protein
MELKYKYSIGGHMVFYEIEMLEENIQSIKNALQNVDNKENVNIDYFFNISECFEKVDVSKITKEKLVDRFTSVMENLKVDGYNVTYTVYADDDKPYTMTDYRRDFNYNKCQHYDYLIWNESDMLIPAQAFEVLDMVKDYASAQGIHRYITTFAVRKMWDDSWKELEHVKFENCKYLEKSDEGCFTEPHSIRYTMSIDEMNAINAEAESPDLRVLRQPKFDGSMLIMSSDLIKFGVNIPPGIFGLSGEDTAFMYNCMQLMGQNYVQFVIKNILKVHNREHPQKRNYALTYDGKDVSIQSNKGDWYNKMRDVNKQNLDIMFQPQGKFLSWEDALGGKE